MANILDALICCDYDYMIPTIIHAQIPLYLWSTSQDKCPIQSFGKCFSYFIQTITEDIVCIN